MRIISPLPRRLLALCLAGRSKRPRRRTLATWPPPALTRGGQHQARRAVAVLKRAAAKAKDCALTLERGS